MRNKAPLLLIKIKLVNTRLMIFLLFSFLVSSLDISALISAFILAFSFLTFSISSWVDKGGVLTAQLVRRMHYYNTVDVHYEEHGRQAQKRKTSKHYEQHLRAQSFEHDDSSRNYIADHCT